MCQSLTSTMNPIINLKQSKTTVPTHNVKDIFVTLDTLKKKQHVKNNAAHKDRSKKMPTSENKEM